MKIVILAFNSTPKGNLSMTMIKWRDTFDTGVEQFDIEHHKIVEFIDLMFFAIRDNSDKDATEKVCTDVFSYAKHHFANEENAMRAANYPDLEKHIDEHAWFVNEATKFHTILSNNFPEGRTEFYQFLRKWLVSHIQDCDKKYAPYIKGQVD